MTKRFSNHLPNFRQKRFTYVELIKEIIVLERELVELEHIYAEFFVKQIVEDLLRYVAFLKVHWTKLLRSEAVTFFDSIESIPTLPYQLIDQISMQSDIRLFAEYNVLELVKPLAYLDEALKIFGTPGN